MARTIIFSIALILAAAVLGFQVKQVGGGRETISVKGLAEKPVKADRAEWTIYLQVKGRDHRRCARKAAPRETRRWTSSWWRRASTRRRSTNQTNRWSPTTRKSKGATATCATVQEGHVARQSITVNTD